MTRASRQFFLIVAALALGLALFAAFALRELAPRGAGQGAALIGGPFELTAQNGAKFSDAALKGHATLIFFGYTHCPDFCPTTLTQISSVFAALGPDKNIAGLFITVDPARDTPEAIKAYLESFDPRITGLTGSEAEIRAAAKAFRVYYRRQDGADGAYTMDHTGIVYLMDRSGRFVNAINLDRPANEVADELRAYL